MSSVRTLSLIALLRDDPESGLLRGQVGTVVEQLSTGVYEVEFSDELGRAIATVPLRADEVLELRGEIGPRVA